jgi:hypothetical protein
MTHTFTDPQGNPKASKALIRRGAVLPDAEVNAETQLRDMFILSAFEEIQIPINSANGARVWDIVERFAKHRTASILMTLLFTVLCRLTCSLARLLHYNGPVSGELKSMEEENREAAVPIHLSPAPTPRWRSLVR